MRFLDIAVIVSAFFLMVLTTPAWAGSSAIGNLESITGQKIERPDYSNSFPPPVSPPSATGPKVSKPTYTQPNLHEVIAGAIFQSLASSLFHSTPRTSQNASEQAALIARQKADALAAWQAMQLQREKDAAFQAEHQKIVQSFEPSGGLQTEGFKGAAGSDMTFKTLDSDAESLAANAGQGFDTPVGTTEPIAQTWKAAKPTPFFGDKMPAEDVRLLIDPDNDPRVVDLRNAKAFVVKNLKNESEKQKGEPIIKTPDCKKLLQTLRGFRTQRDKFYKTINMAQEQYEVWRQQNKNALTHAIKDGLDYLIGSWLRALEKRGELAAQMQAICEKNATRMAESGVDTTAIRTLIKELKDESSGEFADFVGRVDETKKFLTDGMTTLLERMNSSNRKVQQILEDPKMETYFEPVLPEMKTVCDISTLVAASKIFAKWGAEKVPLIAAAEFAVNETYNGMDFVLSFKRMMEADKINGKVLYAAQNLQQHINDISSELQACR